MTETEAINTVETAIAPLVKADVMIVGSQTEPNSRKDYIVIVGVIAERGSKSEDVRMALMKLGRENPEFKYQGSEVQNGDFKMEIFQVSTLIKGY